MKKLAAVIDEIVRVSNEQKVASDLSLTNSSPTISSELALALVKTAELIKRASVEITYEDLNDFIERARNV